MSDGKTPSDNGDTGDAVTLDLLKQIQSGITDPRNIGRQARQQLVAALLSDGYSTSEMAKILKTSDRTIERDRQALRESTVLLKDPKLVSQMPGRLVVEAETVIQRIRRAIRAKDVPAAVRVDAEHRCYQVFSDFIQRMQGLGYLPTAKQQVEADMIHHMGTLPEYRDLESESGRLLQLAMSANDDGNGESTQRITQIADEIKRCRIAEELREIEQTAVRPSVAEDADDGPSDN